MHVGNLNLRDQDRLGALAFVACAVWRGDAPPFRLAWSDVDGNEHVREIDHPALLLKSIDDLDADVLERIRRREIGVCVEQLNRVGLGLTVVDREAC